jgi:O-antigen ligase
MTPPNAHADDPIPAGGRSGGRLTATSSKPRRRRRSKAQPLVKPPRWHFEMPRYSTLIGVALVVVAMVFGGGGTLNPQTEMILEVATAALLLVIFVAPDTSAGLPPVPVGAWLAATPLVLLFLAQLVPLPPSIWRILPGREIEAAALDLIGAGSAWMPLTVEPPETFASLLGTLAPIATMLYISRLDLQGRSGVALAVALVAIASIALGALQIVRFAGGTWSLYQLYSDGWLGGFQSNRNAQADVLQIGMLATATASLVRVRRLEFGRLNMPVVFGVIIVMAISVLMTGSRAGIALLPITFAFVVAILWPRLKRKVRFLRLWIAGTVTTIAIAGYGLSRSAAIQTAIGRFGDDTGGRWGFWMDTLLAIRKTWPAGTGIGTFLNAYLAIERLELVNPLFVNRAHNDWLEWTLECGPVGWLAIIVTFVVLVWLARASWRQAAAVQHDPIQRAQILFSIGTLVIIGLHALVDYPTRAMSLATIMGVAVAFLTPVSQRPSVINTGQ